MPRTPEKFTEAELKNLHPEDRANQIRSAEQAVLVFDDFLEKNRAEIELLVLGYSDHTATDRLARLREAFWSNVPL